MEIISGGFRSGKTYNLIVRSIYEGIPILVKSRFLKDQYTRTAKKILSEQSDPNLTFPKPVVLDNHHIENRLNDPRVVEKKGILVDDIEDIFSSLLRMPFRVKIKGMTTSENVKNTLLGSHSDGEFLYYKPDFNKNTKKNCP